MESRKGLTRYAWLSVVTAIAIIALKVTAYRFTGSIGFLSDALESGANIVAAVITLAALLVAARPPDKEHEYGHSKAEYLSSGAEGALILIAAAYIAVQAVRRLQDPQPLDQVGAGVLISTIAAAANFAVARVLMRAGRQHRSTALTADAHHLMTDVWTSLGVIVGVGLAGLTGWLWLDPVVALVVALQIVVTGYKLMRESVDGLMDTALPADEIAQIVTILERFSVGGVTYHAMRTRRAGAQRFVSVHIQVPGDWRVQQGHELLEAIERDVRRELAPINVITHLEPVEDPVSWQDASLNRAD
jgi:cation diffusion facilitator family transporter